MDGSGIEGGELPTSQNRSSEKKINRPINGIESREPKWFNVFAHLPLSKCTAAEQPKPRKVPLSRASLLHKKKKKKLASGSIETAYSIATAVRRRTTG